jgi:hypothetical protein
LNDRLISIVCLLATSVVGLVSLLAKLRAIKKKGDFACEYNQKLQEYVQSDGRNLEAYGWLIHRSNKMQNQMGRTGILASFKPPFANYAYNHYPIILNMVPALRQAFSDRFLSTDQLAHSYASSLLECTIRHIGMIEDHAEIISGRLKNPFIWFSEGVTLALSLPVRILGWFGVLGGVAVSGLTSNILFKGISALVALIGFASAIVGLATGWAPFVAWTHDTPFVAKIMNYLGLLKV